MSAETRTIEPDRSPAANQIKTRNQPAPPPADVYFSLPPATPVERAFWDELVKSRRVRRKALKATPAAVAVPLSRLTPKALRLLDLHRKAVLRDAQRQLRQEKELRARRMPEPETDTAPGENCGDWLASEPDWLASELKDQSGQDAFLYQSWQQKRKPKGFARPDAMRKHPKLGEVTDFYGELWDIRQIRPTHHGFDAFYGSRASQRDLTSNLHLIPTPELHHFWDMNRAKPNGLIYDLPAGRTTLKRARKKLGFNFPEEVTEFWTNRVDDLQSLSAHEFVEKHGVTHCAATGRRHAIFGNRTRPAGWWRKPRYIEILLSDLTLDQAGKKLGISISQTHRLRRRAKAEL
jgi:hypothetical protein